MEFGGSTGSARLLDLDCILAASNGDQVALTQLLMRYDQQLARIVRSRIPDDLRPLMDEQDILQDMRIEVCRRIVDFEADSLVAFDAWVMTITNHVLLNHIKAQRTLKRGGGRCRLQPGASLASSMTALLDEVLVVHHTASSSVARREAVAAMEVALESLGDEQQFALRLRYFEGLDAESAAVRMNKTPEAVRALCYRAIVKLQSEFATQEEIDTPSA